MTHLVCEVAEGLRASEATAAVRDYAGRTEFLPIDRGILTRMQDQYLLPVRVLFQDDVRKAAFVQLPDETDSGITRLWVPLGDVLSREAVA